MTEITQSMESSLRGLIDDLTLSSEAAEARRKIAGPIFDYYKFEYAAGEKHAYDDAVKKLGSLCNKILADINKEAK